MTTAALERILSTPLRTSSDFRGDPGSVRVAADGYHVATVSKSMNDREAYAQMFAASPDMASAIKNFFETWDRCGGSTAVSPEEFASRREAMRAALKKSGLA